MHGAADCAQGHDVRQSLQGQEREEPPCFCLDREQAARNAEEWGNDEPEDRDPSEDRQTVERATEIAGCVSIHGDQQLESSLVTAQAALPRRRGSSRPTRREY